MITCRSFAEQLYDFMAEQLAPEHREGIEEHLRQCTSCVAYLESYQLTIQMSRQLPCPPLPIHLAEKLRQVVGAGLPNPGAEGPQPEQLP